MRGSTEDNLRRHKLILRVDFLLLYQNLFFLVFERTASKVVLLRRLNRMPDEKFVADRGRFSGRNVMSPHVSFLGRGSDESSPTDIAFERALACMAPHVVAKVAVCREGDTTDGALIGFYPLVDPHVDF